MKDKELRTLLEEKGIIHTFVDCALVRAPFEGFDLQNHEALVIAVEKLKEKVMEQDIEIRNLIRAVVQLEAKFEATNKHYGITVEKPVDEYTVTKL
jgi:hypothetical protein